MAAQDNVISSGNGIVASSLEKTIDNVGQIAVEGMDIADDEILKVIIENKKSAIGQSDETDEMGSC